MSKQSQVNNKLVRELPIVGIRQTETENGRKFVLSFSSEEPYDRYFGPEILDHSEGAVDLTRLQEIGVVLYNHDRDKVIGKILSVGIENGRGVAEIEFDDDEESEVIFKKVKSGTLKGVSVGYIVNVWEEVTSGEKSTDGRFDGPCYIAKKWMPYEVSIVSVPADPTVGVGREMETSSENERSGSVLANALRQLQINKNYL